METKTDEAFGVVPIHMAEDGYQVLLVNQISYRKDSFWILPKGHAETGESNKATALRELEEETGLSAVELDPTFSSTMRYTFKDQGIKINKSVTYFLGYVSDPTTTISEPDEIKAVCWCSPKEALEQLSHQNTKEVLHDALLFLAKKEVGN